jgi:hypothetical protein
MPAASSGVLLKAPAPLVKSLTRWMVNTHVWVGVVATALLVVIAVTGILLNHKSTLGLMPEAPASEAGLAGALSLEEIVRTAEGAVGARVAAAGVDRMDVRPDKGFAKVRFSDRVVTEVTVALRSGEVLQVGERNDVFLEKLHSGEIFGDGWILLSDGVAVGLLLLLVTGAWMWLYPRVRL